MRPYTSISAPQRSLVLQNKQVSNQNNSGLNGDGSNNIINSGNNNQVNQFITPVSTAEEEDVELDRLLGGYVSKDALHNFCRSPPKCHPGTRKTVRKEIREWIEDEHSPLLWLNGPAGVGKSVIAKTVAGTHDQVVATFFFSTSSDRTATTLFPTLARQLAWSIPETTSHIITSLKNKGPLLTSEFEEQFDRLIVQPLKTCNVASTSLPVMIIDGVDECTDENMLLQFLRVLVRAGEKGDMPLRFIICSRPEPHIHAILNKIYDDNQETEPQSIVPDSRRLVGWRSQLWKKLPFSDIQTHIYAPMIWGFRNPSLLLQEVWKLYRPVQLGVDKGGQPREMHFDSTDKLDRISYHHIISNIQIGFSEESKEDIAKYLTDIFSAVGRQLGEDPKSWFQQCNISQLVQRSCGQFLYASTIVRLLDDFHPMDVLKMARQSSMPTPDLNKLYKAILEQAQVVIRNRAQECCVDYDTEVGILKDTLAILIVLAENAHFFNVRENFAVIESLLVLEKGRLTTKLSKMHSVLSIVPGESINVHHRSFLEFLQSRERSEEHYIAYPSALRRFLFLLGRAGLRYTVMDWHWELQDDDKKVREHVERIALAYRRNYFKRASSPVTMIIFHDAIHCSLLFLLWVPVRHFPPQFRESLVGASISSSGFTFILQYLFQEFFCPLVLSSGLFIIILTIYIWGFQYSLIFPVFHPFLHPHFVVMARLLLSPQRLSIVMFIIATLSLLSVLKLNR